MAKRLTVAEAEVLMWRGAYLGLQVYLAEMKPRCVADGVAIGRLENYVNGLGDRVLRDAELLAAPQPTRKAGVR